MTVNVVPLVDEGLGNSAYLGDLGDEATGKSREMTR